MDMPGNWSPAEETRHSAADKISCILKQYCMFYGDLKYFKVFETAIS